MKGIIISLLLLTSGVAALAHGGFEHVTGTVTKVADSVVTVKTAKGDVTVKFDGKTEFSKGDKKALAVDMKVGARVVIDVPETGDKTAHSVKIGVVAVAKTK